MTEIQTSQNVFVNPTLQLKNIDTASIPDLSVISEEDFKRYVYTGISIVIDTPIVKNSRNAIFGINTDGFIPQYNMGNTVANGPANVMRNLFPVQPTPQSVTFVHIYQEQMMMPIQALYASNRFISGSVGVGLRFSSNTGQSGNFMVAQATGVVRKYAPFADTYAGIEANNTALNVSDYSFGNFALLDLSLNRQVSLRATKRDVAKRMDIQKKVSTIYYNHYPNTTLTGFYDYNAFATQFQEDWLLFAPLWNVPNQNANQLTITVFFDYSNVNFEVPVFPIIPMGSNQYAQAFLNWSLSFVGTTALPKGTWIFSAGFLSEKKIKKKSKEAEATDSNLSTSDSTTSDSNKLNLQGLDSSLSDLNKLSLQNSNVDEEKNRMETLL